MVISRIPKWAKEIIIQRASEQHCDDYGAAIADLVKLGTEYEALKFKFFNNQLDVNLLINDKHSEAVKEEDKGITFASGKEMKGGKIK